MTAAHLAGLPTSTVLREAAVVLEQAGTPTAYVYAAQLRARADLLCGAVGALEVVAATDTPDEAGLTGAAADILRAVGEIRGR